MDRRDFLKGSTFAITSGCFGGFIGGFLSTRLRPKYDEKQFAAIVFRDFVFWQDEKNAPLFYNYNEPALDQTIHGWVVTAADLEYMYVYQIGLSNCTGVHTNSIPIKVYKHRVSSKENFQDYLCAFTESWIMGKKTYQDYLPPVKQWCKLGGYFQTGAIC
jgi:hypothetical protein